MSQRYFKTVFLIGSAVVLLLLPGCVQKDTDLGKEVLIRVGDRNLTVLDFYNAFELTKIAYGNRIRQQPEDLRNAQVRLLNQLTVEMILLEQAQKLGISVADSELEQAVSQIKSDYPEGEFEKTLLEYAVSYDSWKKRLKNRLIMDKVIEEELNSRITITAEDISEYYQKHYQDREMESGSAQPSEDINEVIVRQLRRQKAEETYHSWIEGLKNQYVIDINSELWEKITGSQSTIEDENTVGDDAKSG